MGSRESTVTMYIALLRGINVGGKNRLPMSDLITVLKSLGYEDIRTYIQSGNVVFSSKRKIGEDEDDRISGAISAEKGFRPKVILLTAEQLREAIENNPFAADEGKTLHLFFLDSPPKNPDLERLHSLKTASEEFTLQGRILYLYAPDGLGRSRLAATIERSLGVPATARNYNTISKLASMADVS